MEVTAEENSTTTKAKIISFLKEFGEATVLDLAEYLSLTQMAIRKHLNSLSIQGLISTKKINNRVGRPKIIYSMFKNPNEKTDGQQFAVELLDAVKESYGDNVVIDLISKRNNKFLERNRDRLVSKTTIEKIYETAKIFNENGYDTDVEEDHLNQKILIKHKICPFPEIASKHAFLCVSETGMLESFIGTKIERICHLCAGDKCCIYEVQTESNTKQRN